MKLNSNINCPVEKQSNKKLIKKKNQSLPTFPCDLDFIEEHRKLFKTISTDNNFNSFFKDDLRNYDYIKLKSVESKSRTARSSITLKETTKQLEKPFKRRLQKSRFTENQRESVEVILPPFEFNKQFDSFGTETETEEDTFYSPYSQISQSFNNLINSKHTLDIMAEEADEIPVTEDNVENNEAPPEAEQQENVENNESPVVDETPAATTEPVADETGPTETNAEDGAVTENVPDETPATEATETPAADTNAAGDDVVQSETTDDDMREIQQMIQEASRELENVATIDEIQPNPPQAEDNGSVFKFNAANDALLLQELEYSERQAKETANKITKIKERLEEILKKETCTEVEAKELEQLNQELKQQMDLLESQTKRIQFLLGQKNLFENMIQPQPTLPVKRAEDALPKVIVCGLTETNIPKLIVCDDMKKKKKKKSIPQSSPRSDAETPTPTPMPVVPRFDNYNTIQCTPRSERQPLQNESPPKEQILANLQNRICTIQNEIRNISQESNAIRAKIQEYYQNQTLQKQSCGRDMGVCPVEMQLRLKQYTQTTNLLEQQLCQLENEVSCMQCELCEGLPTDRSEPTMGPPVICSSPCEVPASHVCQPSYETQLRQLKEQYNRLQDDYKSKLTEVAGLRTENEKLKQVSTNGENVRRRSDEQIRENYGRSQLVGNKEQMLEMEQQMNVAKQRFREAQDELEELRALVQDQQAQINDYRNKYLEAQQIVEEQKRQINMMEIDSLRINEEINLDIQQIKNQFQQKLEELSPLPELLKSTQLKLQETEQMYQTSEKINETLQYDLQMAKDRAEQLTCELEQINGSDRQNEQMTTQELLNENARLKDELAKLQNEAEENSREIQQNAHEIAQLVAQLENVREESARQVARIKDRSETVRRSMQNQINDFERQLAQSRAQTKTIQKERDEIRRKMQEQINNLYRNFQDAQVRIRSLQGHMEFLKEPFNTATLEFNSGDMSYSEGCNCNSKF